MFQARDIAAIGVVPHQKTCPLSVGFGWMAFLGLEPSSVGVASAEGLHDWVRRAVPILNYTLTFALQPRKSTENLSQCTPAATVPLVAPTWLPFEGQPRLACCTSVHLGYRGT
jgi:hypothetical protein